MRIAHISDLHIRNFKYRKEYLAAFEDLYRKLEILKPDLIINTGDTVHSKLAVSPELFDDVAVHMQKTARIARYWMILGNHDLNLKNKTRSDAISPIVRALRGNDSCPVSLLTIPTSYGLEGHPGFVFWNYDIRHQNYTFKYPPSDSDVNIGLFHGSISGCTTDIGFVMEDGEAEVSKFDQMDYVLLGDIHKRQSFRGGRMQYPGSLIQQNYGEELVKGFLLWDIKDKSDFSVAFHPVEAPGRFYTVSVPTNFSLDGIDIPLGSRIRARYDGELSPSKRVELEKLLVERFQPLEVITPDSSADITALADIDLDRLVGDRRVMMGDHLKERGLSDQEVDSVIALWDVLSSSIEEPTARGTSWELKRISWDNMMNYGEDNSINIEKLSGLVGIFGPNTSGKSTIFDIILESLFDRVSKEVPRNIDLINDNKDKGSMNVEFTSSGHSYFIEREIERISYGQRKLSEVKQWGKTSLEFATDGEVLTGTSRPETEKSIRAVIGSFEDFVLTTMVSQNPVFGLPGGGDIINCKETDRRKILFRFLDLDIYEKVNHLCRDELKSIIGSLKQFDRDQMSGDVAKLKADIASTQVEIDLLNSELEWCEADLTALRDEMSRLGVTDLNRLETLQEELIGKITGAKEEMQRQNVLAAAGHRAYKKLRDEMDLLESSKPLEAPVGMDELADQLRIVRKRAGDINVAVNANSNMVSAGKKAIQVLSEVPCEGKFPTCKFISDAVKFRDEEAELSAALLQKMQEKVSIGAELAELESFEVRSKQLSAWEKKISQCDRDLVKRVDENARVDEYILRINETICHLQREHDSVVEKIDQLSLANVRRLADEIEQKTAALSKVKSKLNSWLKTIGGMEEKLLDMTSDLQDIDERRRRATIYEHLAEATSKGGLPYRILSRVLPLINHEIAKILGNIAKFSVFFEDDQEAQSISLYIRYGDYRSRPLGLGSGAEKFIASLAVRVALLSVSSLPKTDMLIIDEGFGKLDPEHLEALQRMFEYLKETFGKVFIVSHVDFMRDIVDHSIEISSEAGYAHVSM